MNKEIVLMAASKKFRNLCIAGIDRKTGEWIRIISGNRRINHAVPEEDTLYENGDKPKILDIIGIECLRYEPNYYQPENHIFNPEYYWRYLGRCPVEKILHKVNETNYIFFDNNKRIHKSIIEQLDDSQKHSLMMIRPYNVKVHIQEYEERKLSMSFSYKGFNYRYLAITDLQFMDEYMDYELGTYSLDKDVLLVISLGDCYSRDSSHYKLIATVIYI